MEYFLVFGASGGIGKEFCKALAKRGENLIISGRNQLKLELLREELNHINPKINVINKSVNLQDEEDRKNAFSFIEKSDIKIKGLYFVAGIDTRKPFENYTEEKLINQARVNFESAVSSTLFSLKNRANELEILIVSSTCGFTPMPYFSLYSATKNALITFYKGLKSELKGKKVKITVLCPGSVPTRSDIIEDIKKQGFIGKLSKKSPEFIVKKGLKALKKNKTVCVPGFYNKFVVFLSKITPYKIQSKIISRKFKDMEKDAF